MNLVFLDMYKIFYTEKARHDLRECEKNTAKRIIRKIHFFSQQTSPLTFAKKLTEHALGEYRFRIGEYRALFDIDKQGNISILMILRIKHRKDVYNLR